MHVIWFNLNVYVAIYLWFAGGGWQHISSDDVQAIQYASHFSLNCRYRWMQNQKWLWRRSNLQKYSRQLWVHMHQWVLQACRDMCWWGVWLIPCFNLEDLAINNNNNKQYHSRSRWMQLLRQYLPKGSRMQKCARIISMCLPRRICHWW